MHLHAHKRTARMMLRHGEKDTLDGIRNVFAIAFPLRERHRAITHRNTGRGIEKPVFYKGAANVYQQILHHHTPFFSILSRRFSNVHCCFFVIIDFSALFC